MGLNSGDREKLQKELSIKDCYKRIYEWHKKYGKRRIKQKYKRDDAYSKPI